MSATYHSYPPLACMMASGSMILHIAVLYAQVEAEQSKREAEGLQAQAAERAAHAAAATGLRSQARSQTALMHKPASDGQLLQYLRRPQWPNHLTTHMT